MYLIYSYELFFKLPKTFKFFNVTALLLKSNCKNINEALINLI